MMFSDGRHICSLLEKFRNKLWMLAPLVTPNQRKIKAAIIDDKIPYSVYLSQALKNLPLVLNFYVPAKDLKRKVTLNDSFSEMKKVWHPYLYPFETIKEMLKDGTQLLHVQFDFHVFGSVLSSLFLPVLLILLKLFGRARVVTIHAVIPRHLINKKFMKDNAPKIERLPPLFLKIILILVYRLIGSLSTAIIVHYKIWKKWLVSGYKINQKRIFVIPHGVDNGEYIINSNRLNVFKKKFWGKKIILFFGVLSPRKGLETLFSAFAQISSKYPEYVLVVAGGESAAYKGYIKKIKSLVDKLGLNDKILFLGFIDEEDVPSIFSVADFIVFPYTYPVGGGGVLSFAIKYGKPIIATTMELFTEDLNNRKNALLVRPENTEELSSALETLITDKELKERLAQNIRLEAIENSWQKVAKTHFALYEKSLSKYKR